MKSVLVFLLVAVVGQVSGLRELAISRKGENHPYYNYEGEIPNEDVLLLATFGFYAGGKYMFNLEASNNIQNTQNKQMFWLLSCTEREYDIILRAEMRQHHGYCYNLYSDTGLCRGWNLEKTEQSRDGYSYTAAREVNTEILREHELEPELLGSGYQEQDKEDDAYLLYFLLVNCEALGGNVNLTESGVCATLSSDEMTESDRRACALQETSQSISYYLQLQYRLENVDSYLSTTEMPYEAVYTWAAILSIPIAAVWILNNRRWAGDQDVSLQNHMSRVPVTKMLFLITLSLQYHLKQIGEPYQYMHSVVFPVQLLCRVAYNYCFAETLLLIGKGWKVTRENLLHLEHKQVYSLVALYSVGTFAAGVTNGMDRFPTSSGAVVGLMLMSISYILLLHNVWYAASRNIEATKYHLETIRFHHMDPTSTPIYQTYLMLINFRALFFGYLLTALLLDVLTVPMLRRKPWVPLAINECSELAMYLLVGFVFRARSFEPYLQSTRPSNQGVHETRDRRSGPLAEWQPGSSLPPHPRSDLLYHVPHGAGQVTPLDAVAASPKRPILAVVNPGEQVATAVAVECSHRLASPTAAVLPTAFDDEDDDDDDAAAEQPTEDNSAEVLPTAFDDEDDDDDDAAVYQSVAEQPTEAAASPADGSVAEHANEAAAGNASEAVALD